MSSMYVEELNIGVEISAKDYILKCTRAFSILESMYGTPLNSPIPEQLKYDNFYAREVKLDEERLEELNNMSDKEIEDKIKDARESELEYMKIKIKTLEEKQGRYQDMIDKVEAWDTPKDRELYENIKSFAISQLTNAIRDDCHTDSLKDKVVELENKELPTVDEYRRTLVSNYVDRIQHSIRESQEYRETITERNKCLKILRDSLETL